MSENGCSIGVDKWVYLGELLGMIRIETLRITQEILSLVAEIDEFKGAWRALGTLAPERLSALRRVATIESIGSSTRIEGSKLTDKEIEKLLGSRGRHPHTDTIHRHLEEWMGELNTREVLKRFDDRSSIKIGAKRLFVEIQIHKEIIAPWANKNGIKTFGEICKIKKQGFPPSLQKKIQKARFEYLSS